MDRHGFEFLFILSILIIQLFALQKSEILIEMILQINQQHSNMENEERRYTSFTFFEYSMNFLDDHFQSHVTFYLIS